MLNIYSTNTMNDRGDKLMRAFMASIRADKEAKCQRMEEHVQMRQLVVDAIVGLRRKVKLFMPQNGDFKVIYSEFDNPDNTINLSYLRLKVSPVGLEGREKIRHLEFAAFKEDCPYQAEIAVFRGTKQEILDKLDSEELPNELLRLIPKLEDDLEDI